MTPSALRGPKVANQEDSWSVLRHLSSQLDLPWVCISDFNEITKIEEKSGGAIWAKKQMQNFRDCLDFCGLLDLGFIGVYLLPSVTEGLMVRLCGCV